MAKIALAAAGAVAGFLIAGPFGLGLGVNATINATAAGLAVGEAIGAVAFPRRQQINQLQSLQVSSSADGAPIPFGYGFSRHAGQIIWSPGLTYVEAKQTPGKGGALGFDYFCTFAVAWGEGPGAIHRIWMDSKLIYQASGVTFNMQDIGSYAFWNSSANYVPGDLVLYLTPGATGVGSQLVWQCVFPNTNQAPSLSGQYWELASQYPPWDDTATYAPGAVVGYFTEVYAAIRANSGAHPNSSPSDWEPLVQYYGTPAIYPGDELQTPDPTIEAVMGVGNTQAFRGLIYSVHKNFPVGNFGNRLGNLRAEVLFG